MGDASPALTSVVRSRSDGEEDDLGRGEEEAEDTGGVLTSTKTAELIGADDERSISKKRCEPRRDGARRHDSFAADMRDGAGLAQRSMENGVGNDVWWMRLTKS